MYHSDFFITARQGISRYVLPLELEFDGELVPKELANQACCGIVDNL
jgi:hypothetical protein